MTTTLPPRTNASLAAANADRRTSFTSFPASVASSLASSNPPLKLSPHPSVRKDSTSTPSRKPSVDLIGNATAMRKRPKRLQSQYPLDSRERHVEYILVAAFDIDDGPVMEHQYPGPISGDEHMLAELMLPDQTHMRSQDWTIFFLHKDASEEEAEAAEREARRERRKERREAIERGEIPADDVEESEESSDDDDEEAKGGEGPPLMYVLNLVNTKHDTSVRRGAVVKAMAICTRHSFLHIYKPLLLLALEDYFKNPFPETLASLYDSVNAMDLSLMPKLSMLERSVLQASDAKDMFVEKFERMIQQKQNQPATAAIQDSPSKNSQKIAVPRDTHEFESKVVYNDIPIPIKVPTAISPETVGDFSLIKLIQTFATPHSTTPQPFALHPHLTTSGAFTHPVIVLVNALLTQKRVIFLGHNRPSGEVAEAVLAACALASGGVLRGFTRHAFPYTDLTKIDDLLKVPGFVAGVTNPAFSHHPEWWDLLCDLPSGRMKISSRIENAPVTEGLVYFQQQNPTLATQSGGSSGSSLLTSGYSSSHHADPTGDNAFMEDIMRSITSRHGENIVRSKWRAYIVKFTRISAAFEEFVYGASALYVMGPDTTTTSSESPTSPSGYTSPGITSGDPATATASLHGHGYVWQDEGSKQRELAAWVSRIEGWRNTRSYYAFIQDLAALYYAARPIKTLDLHHHHDRLRNLRLTVHESGAIYLAFAAAVKDYNTICQLLAITPENQAGLFYISLGLFHQDETVRVATLELLGRIRSHEAGRHFWAQLNRFAKLSFFRMIRDRDLGSPAAEAGPGHGEGAFGMGMGSAGGSSGGGGGGGRNGDRDGSGQMSLVGIAMGGSDSRSASSGMGRAS